MNVFQYNGRSMVELLKNLIIPRYQNNFYPLLLRKQVIAVFTLLILGVNILASSIGGSVFAGAVSSAELVTFSNQERSAAGLSPLQIDARLVSAAHAKAQSIFELQYWSHYGPNGESPWQFILGSGYSYVYAGENLAKGFNSSQAVHSAWMASQTHRENILSVNYSDLGVAVVPGNLQGEDIILVVQMFGSISQPAPLAESVVSNTSVTQAPTSTPAESQLPVEGESSITIEYPENGTDIADSEFFMNGTATKSIESIVVTDNDTEGTGEISEEGEWDYRPEEGWREGLGWGRARQRV